MHRVARAEPCLAVAGPDRQLLVARTHRDAVAQPQPDSQRAADTQAQPEQDPQRATDALAKPDSLTRWFPLAPGRLCGVRPGARLFGWVRVAG